MTYSKNPQDKWLKISTIALPCAVLVWIAFSLIREQDESKKLNQQYPKPDSTESKQNELYNKSLDTTK
jgi:hypothetical protein